MMNPEVKAKWLEALRSGKYKQGKGKLRDGDRFCCLGVLCDISGHDYCNDSGILPPKVMQWSRLEDESPEVNGRMLSSLNDWEGYGFKRLANMIEKYL